MRPARILLVAVIGTQLPATLCGLWTVDAAIDWGWALAAGSYALAWFLVNDQVKLTTYRILDSHQSLLARKHTQ